MKKNNKTKIFQPIKPVKTVKAIRVTKPPACSCPLSEEIEALRKENRELKSLLGTIREISQSV